MTAGELSYFSVLGANLGYFVRREMKWHFPRDLCWCKTSATKSDEEALTRLYLERENSNGRSKATVQKLTTPDNSKEIPYLVAVFGHIRERDLDIAKDIVRARLLSHV